MTTISGTCATPSPTQFEQDSIDTDINRHVEDHVRAVEDSYMERIADLERQIATTDDPQRALELQDEIMELENAFDDFKDDVDRMSGDRSAGLAGVGGFITDMVNADELQEVVSDFRQTISDSYAEYGTADVPAGVEEQKPAWEPLTIDLPFLGGLTAQVDLELLDFQVQIGGASEGGETTASSGAGESSGAGSAESASSSEETSGSGESSSSEGVGATEVDGRSVGEMTNLMSNDPDSFMAEMQDMDPEDRNEMMILVQQQLQEMNQMFQMMTQFQQVMHDTQKAAIQNMRV